MSNKSLLLVDDDPDDIMMLQEAIQSIDPDFTFLEASDGLQALNSLKELKQHNKLPCLIILDINMPILDGRKTLSILKNDEGLKHIPVVVFSTSSNHADRAYCNKHGVELISKPFDMMQLTLKAEELIRHCA